MAETPHDALARAVERQKRAQEVIQQEVNRNEERRQKERAAQEAGRNGPDSA